MFCCLLIIVKSSLVQMTKREDGQINTINHIHTQFLLRNGKQTIGTTLGIIIDCTLPYPNKLKINSIHLLITDQSCHQFLKTPKHLSVYIKQFSSTQVLPTPRKIGDILYLKRFKCDHSKEQFQALNINTKNNFFSWALFDGDAENYSQPYQTSKQSHFKVEQQFDLRKRVKTLLQFSHTKFLNQSDILKLLPSKPYYTSANFIVKVIQKSPFNYIVSNGTRNMVMPPISTFASEGSVALLRAVKILTPPNRENEIVQIKTSEYSSLMQLPQRSLNYFMFNNLEKLYLKVPKQQYRQTSLQALQKITSSESLGRTFNIKVEICAIDPLTFDKSVKFYHRDTNIILDHRTSLGETKPIYLIKLVCADYKHLQFMTEVYICSYDGKCVNFLDDVELEKELEDYQYHSAELNAKYQRKLQSMLNSEYVCLQVTVDWNQDRSKHILRVAKITEVK